MGKAKLESPKRTSTGSRPDLTVESRENRMISLAIDLAEQQLRDGTASSQVITHYLKLGSTKERLEKEIMERQRDLITAKTDAINSTRSGEEKYNQVVEALRRYSGLGGSDEYDD